MTHYVAPAAIATSTSIANLVGQLTGHTTISVGEALTVFVFVGGLCVYIARKLQRIEDELEHLKDQSDQMKEKLDGCALGGCPKVK